MSGGYFEYKQHTIGQIIEDLEDVIYKNGTLQEDDYGNKFGHNFSVSTIEKFKQTLKWLELAQIASHRVDWLLSGDDGEETFHERWKDDMEKLKY